MSRFLLVLAVAVSSFLTACSHDRDPVSGLSLSTKPLVSYNYAAVDALMSRAGAAIKKDTPMLVGTIGNVNDVESSSTLGRTITEQASARLAQKGYKVAELKLRQGISIQRGGLSSASSGEYLLSRDVSEIAGEHKAAAALTGTYSVGANNVLVNLRLLDIRSGNVITAYDYVLPKNADVLSMVGNADAASSGFFLGTRSFQ
ncbi:MAG TPA: FlgO family outer membrane protein [Alphaproteobacteria bacterium]